MITINVDKWLSDSFSPKEVSYVDRSVSAVEFGNMPPVISL